VLKHGRALSKCQKLLHRDTKAGPLEWCRSRSRGSYVRGEYSKLAAAFEPGAEFLVLALKALGGFEQIAGSVIRRALIAGFD